MRTPYALLLGLAFPLACERVESDDVLTSGVYAHIDVVADGQGASFVETILKVGGQTSNTFLELSGDDRLEARAGGEAQAMTRRDGVFGALSYTAEFDGDAADTPFEVAFLRAIDDGAPSSAVTLPAPFALTAPAATLRLARGTDDLVVTWEGAGQSDPMELRLSGDCIMTHVQELEDDSGSFTLPAGTLVPPSDDAPSECPLRLTLARARQGTLDGGYGKGGRIEASQERVVEFASTP